jgi:hypothetical protein
MKTKDVQSIEKREITRKEQKTPRINQLKIRRRTPGRYLSKRRVRGRYPVDGPDEDIQ